MIKNFTGEKGTPVLPDPNRYMGDVMMKRFKDSEWRGLPGFIEYEGYGRGIGIMDMIRSIEADVPHRASVEMAYHVTEVIFAMDEAGETHREVAIESTAEKPSGLRNTPETILWK